MDFSSLKNTRPIFLYFISIGACVLANIIKEINITLYYVLLVVAVVFFFFGLTRRIKK
jgi:hypothetical protein